MPLKKPTLPTDIALNVANAIREDLGLAQLPDVNAAGDYDFSAYIHRDLTAQLVSNDVVTAKVISREPATICGLAWFEACFTQVDPRCEITWYVNDGTRVNHTALICEITGPAQSLLTAERPALNFLQTLSATATLATTFANKLDGLPTKVRDSRKTIPGLRTAQKYAVLAGGCANHRIGLHDAILIKENHISAAGSLTQAVDNARALIADTASDTPIELEVEVETLDELTEALNAGVELILIDNFDLDQSRAACALRDQLNPKALLEASGNITLDTVRAVAETGVDYIATGQLTKDINAIDFSMRFGYPPTKTEYGAEDIIVLQGLTAVLKRPAMYLGDIERDTLGTELIMESLCHALDEHLDGNCTTINIAIDKDHIVTVTYDAGLPLSPNEQGQDIAALRFTGLHQACESQKKHIEIGDEFCQFGLAVLNGVSTYMCIDTHEQGTQGTWAYERGLVAESLQLSESSQADRTTIEFQLNEDVLPAVTLNNEQLRVAVNKLRANTRFTALTIQVDMT